MMRSTKQRKISNRQIQDRAAEVLTPIFKPTSSRRCSSSVLLQVVLTAAANAVSLFAACIRLRTISDQTARKALWERLPKQRKALEAKLNAALNQALPSRTLCRRRDLAIDYHEIPYHGKSPENHVVGRKPRSGTTKFFAYASACLVDRGHRYTVAYTWVRAQDTTAEVLERLLDELEKIDVKIRKVLLDRGFFSVAVMSLLQGRKLPFLMPAVMRGRRPARGKKPSGWRSFLSEKAGWYRHTSSHEGEDVAVKVCVAYKTFRHHRTGKRHNRKLVFAAWNVSGPPREICQEYRKRFAIESSYRQLGQARIRTSTRNPLLRLFYVGLAPILRNVWVWLHAFCFGENPEPKARAAAKRLQFKWMLSILSQRIDEEYTTSRTVT